MFDFNYIDRKNTDCLKWDYFDDEIPMWVADMDFRLAPAILEAIENRARHPVFAYNKVPEELYDSYISWWQRRYDLKMERDELLFATGVLASITSILRVFTKEGDNVLLQTPVYHSFFHVIENNNRNVLENPLIFNDGRYSIDFDDLDKKLAHTKVFILCNPHNPIGKVWSRDELVKVYEICLKNEIFIIDDEIHHDLIMPGYVHTVMANVAEDAGMHMAVCTAPSKSFNLAGLQTASIIIQNPEVYDRFKASRLDGFRSVSNVLGMVACEAAYNHGGKWLDECIEVINRNSRYISEFVKANMPEVKIFPLEGTYLLWCDCRALGLEKTELEDFMTEKAYIFADEGYIFGDEGTGFERLNIACPEQTVRETMDRFFDAYKKYIKK